MTLLSQTNSTNSEIIPNDQSAQAIQQERILCLHCQRTATNGIKCKGMCVADSEY